jgi:hypothetical protein
MKIEILAKIKDFLLKNEQKIILIAGFVLASAISFEFGLLQGQKWTQKPLVIEKPAETPAGSKNCQNTSQDVSGDISKSIQTSQGAVTTNTSKCAFVGSRNSDKFYVPTCSWAKRIKPENLVCYNSEQDALTKGKTKSDCK